jgi:hypothetical protein
MIILVSTFVGAFLGAAAARRRKGNGLDIAQYAGVYAILFALLGLFITVILDRMI